MRDVTATIESIPLIASSIMCKKLAEGIDGLALDCKVGAGAFMKTRDRAAELAQALKAIGEAAGKRVTVVLSAMDDPIGVRVGNALEVEEAITVLAGEGPSDTRELTVVLGAEMLLAGGACSSPQEGAERLAAVLDDGSALDVFRRMVEAQGGDPRVVDDPRGILPRASSRTVVAAPEHGYVTAVAADGIGTAALMLGAGRRRKEDRVDPAVGIEIASRPGDEVAVGKPLAVLVHNGRGVEEAAERVRLAFSIGPEAPRPSSRILEVMR